MIGFDRIVAVESSRYNYFSIQLVTMVLLVFTAYLFVQVTLLSLILVFATASAFINYIFMKMVTDEDMCVLIFYKF